VIRHASNEIDFSELNLSHIVFINLEIPHLLWNPREPE